MEVIDTSAAPSPPASRRRTALHRRHAINLCCAQSVAGMVEEIARQLRGLGFDASVSCGAQARAALLGGQAFTQRPTIHVVCVQGSLQERVLKPLRQALATHGGEGQHLFVAVLDLSIPLTMVGHIRRFAEALERTPAAPIRVRDHLGDRRRWREHFGHRELAERPTRSHPVVAERLASGPHPIVRPTEGRKRPRTISTRSRPVRIVPTAKNRQVTAPQSIVEAAASSRGPRRGSGPAPAPQPHFSTARTQPPTARGRTEVAQILPPVPTVVAAPPVPTVGGTALPRRIPPPSLRFPPPPGVIVPTAAEAVATSPEPSPPVATHIGAVAEAIVAAHEAVKAEVAETRQRVEAAVLAEETSAPTPRDTEVPSGIEVRPHGLAAIEIDGRARPGVAIEIDARTPRGDTVVAPMPRAPESATIELEAGVRPRAAAAVEVDATMRPPAVDPPKGRTLVPVAPSAAIAPTGAAHSPLVGDVGDVGGDRPRRRVWPYAAAAVLLGSSAGAYAMRDRWLPAVATATSPSADASAPTSDAPERSALADARRPSKADAREPDDEPSDDATADDAKPDDATADDATAQTPPSTADDAGAAVPAVVPPAPAPAGEHDSEAQLREAVERRRLLEVDDLYVTRKRGRATSFGEARSRCNAYTFDGIDGWRLPWRRELQLIGVSTRMDAGAYWSHSRVDGERSQAWAWSTSERALVARPKRETEADVICVKPKKTGGPNADD